MDFRSGKFYIFFAIVLTIGFIALNIYTSPSSTEASSHENILTGWAWSDNIGWISLNCANDNCDDSDYKIKVDPFSGIFTGYAWSSNVGWINFAPGGSYPEPPLNGAIMVSSPACTSGKEVGGWIRVESQTVGLPNSGGWDGWIKMAGNIAGGGHYGVCLSEDGESLDGYAWGSDVVGWVHFYGRGEDGDSDLGTCSDGIDNGGDGAIDDDDSDCSGGNQITKPPTSPIHIKEVRPK